MKKIYLSRKYLLYIYINALIVFMILRIGFLISYRNDFIDLTDKSINILTSLWMGFRFDTVISLYILALPVLLTIIFSFIGRWEQMIYRIITYFSMIIFSISFSFAAGNIPYYGQFQKTINSSIWNWVSEPSFVLNMIFSESQFLPFIVLFFILDILFCYSIYKWYKYFIENKSFSVPPIRSGYIASVLFSGFIFAICFVGIRGRKSCKSPRRQGTADFCANNTLNNAGLNPNFVLLKTTLDSKKKRNCEISLADEKEALTLTKEYFNIDREVADFDISRIETPEILKEKKNVVVILMESFSSYYLTDSDLTPFVKELSEKGIYFSNTFSAGIHTMNGVYGTLFSYPALLEQHPFKTGDIARYNCWPYVMKQMGYNTLYFTTHDDQFDNIGGYLIANHFEYIIAEKDYPRSQVKSNLGVPDDYMFNRSFEYINKAIKNGNPFMATFLTASNHNPYIIPDYFSCDENEPIGKNIVRYSDWAIKDFFNKAQKEEWYENTIFVLLGDHGSAQFNNLYDVSLCYHQIPFIIYDPQNEEPVVYEKIASQTDIFPTVMGYLGQEFVNSTFGINLLKDSHKYVVFSSDQAYQCISEEFYYTHDLSSEKEAIYDYKNNNSHNYIDSLRTEADEMNKFSASILQTAQFMVRKIQNNEPK